LINDEKKANTNNVTVPKVPKMILMTFFVSKQFVDSAITKLTFEAGSQNHGVKRR
jgi:hypothetical protein